MFLEGLGSPGKSVGTNTGCFKIVVRRHLLEEKCQSETYIASYHFQSFLIDSYHVLLFPWEEMCRYVCMYTHIYIYYMCVCVCVCS